MKTKLSLKVFTLSALLFCAFFAIQSFTIEPELSTIAIEETVTLDSETNDEIGFCRYQLGGVIPSPAAPPWLVNQLRICVPSCRPGGPTNLPCPSPFGGTYEILYQGAVIGTATNIVGLSRKCTPCLVTDQPGVTFRLI